MTTSFLLGEIENPKNRAEAYPVFFTPPRFVWFKNPTGLPFGGELDPNPHSEIHFQTGYPRVHVWTIPTKYRGMGYGTCIYSSLILLAHHNHLGTITVNPNGVPRGNGISSCSFDRLRPANAWWKATRKRYPNLIQKFGTFGDYDVITFDDWDKETGLIKEVTNTKL